MSTMIIEIKVGIGKVANAGKYFNFNEIEKSIGQISIQNLDVMPAIEQITNGTIYISESMLEMSEVSEMTAVSFQKLYID